MAILACRQVTCHRRNWNAEGATRLDGVSAEFDEGNLYGFHGPDGSGKGLLLHVLGLLETADGGEVEILGEPSGVWEEEKRQRVRNEFFGFLFPHPCLIPTFSVAENVAIPLFRICGADARAAQARTREVLELTGIAQFEATLAGRLPPAGQHRVAFARAIVHEPRVLMAFSPRAEEDLVALAAQCAADLGITVLWVGEAGLLRPHAHCLIEMRDGRILNIDPP